MSSLICGLGRGGEGAGVLWLIGNKGERETEDLWPSFLLYFTRASVEVAFQHFYYLFFFLPQ